MDLVYGVDIGGTRTKIGLIDLKSKSLLESKVFPTLSDQGWEAYKKRLNDELKALVPPGKERPRKLGLGIPGPCHRGIVGFFANFPWPRELNVVEQLQKEWNLEIRLDNDVNVIALGEALFGAGKDASSLAAIALGTGIGGGLVLNGQIWSGFSGGAGELGHLVLYDDPNALTCACGLRGCVELYASSAALEREALRWLERLHRDTDSAHSRSRLYELHQNDLPLTTEAIYAAAREHDELALQLVSYQAEHLAPLMGSVINMINPELMVICGGLAASADLLFAALEEPLSLWAIPSLLQKTRFAASELKDEAGIWGAAALWMSP